MTSADLAQTISKNQGSATLLFVERHKNKMKKMIPLLYLLTTHKLRKTTRANAVSHTQHPSVTPHATRYPARFHRDVDACFVPSDRLATLAQKCGLSPGQIRLHGLPIRPGFWGSSYPSSGSSEERQQQGQEEESLAAQKAAAQKASLQEKLGLKPGVKACLVVGGGDGVGGLQGIADSVGHTLGQQGGETQVRGGGGGGTKTHLTRGGRGRWWR